MKKTIFLLLCLMMVMSLSPAYAESEEYSLDIRAYYNGGEVDNNRFLPGESFELVALPELFSIDEFMGESLRTAEDSCWDDYRFVFTSNSAKLTIKQDGSASCETTLSEDALTTEDYSITVALYHKDDMETALASKELSVSVVDSCLRLVVEGMPASQFELKTPYEVSAKLLQMSLNSDTGKVESSEISEQVEYCWSTNEGGFTFEELEENAWAVERISKDSDSLTLEAKYNDECVRYVKDVEESDSSAMFFKEDELCLFSGEARSFTIDANSLKGVDYSTIKWELTYYNSSDVQKQISSSSFSTDGKTIKFTADNATAVAKLLGVTYAGDEGSFSIYAAALDEDGQLVADLIEEVEVTCPVKALDTVEFGASKAGKYSLLKGDKLELEKQTSLYLRNTKNPEGVDYDAKITSVSVDKTKLKLSSSTDSYSLQVIGAKNASGTITVKYSYNGTTGSIAYNYVIVENKYSVDYQLENDSANVLFSSEKHINAVLRKEYYNSSTGEVSSKLVDASSLEWEIAARPWSDGGSYVDESFAPTSEWNLNIKSKSQAECEDCSYMDECYVITAKDKTSGSVLASSEDVYLELRDVFYQIEKTRASIDPAGTREFEIKELAQVKRYDATHKKGIVCDGTNGTEDLCSDLKLVDYAGMIDFDENKIKLLDPDSLAEMFDAGENYASLYLLIDSAVVESEDSWNNAASEELIYTVSCSHHITGETPIEKARYKTSTDDGDGMLGCYECDKCGRMFSREDCQERIKSRTVIPAVTSVKIKDQTASYVYTGKAIEPKVEVKDRTGKVLKENTDYTLSYENNIHVTSSAKVKVSFIGNYTGELERIFSITQASQTLNAGLEIKNENAANKGVLYVGKNSGVVVLKEPSKEGENVGAIKTCALTTAAKKLVTIEKQKDGSWLVKPKAAGTAEIKVTLAGTSDYKETTKSFTVKVVKPTSISKLNIDKTSFVYNGSEQKPRVTSVQAKVGKKYVSLSADLYEINYENATNVTKAAKCIVKVKDECFAYSGSLTKTYSITKASQSLDAKIVPIEGNGGLNEAASSMELYAGQYSVDGDGKVAVIRVSAKGYEPEAAKNLGKITVTSSNAKVAKCTVTADAQAAYDIPIIMGTGTGTANIKVTLAGDSNHNSVSKTFVVKRLKPVELTDAMVSFTGKYADGTVAVTDEDKIITSDSIVIKNGNTVLKLGEDYILSSVGGKSGADQIGSKLYVNLKICDDIKTPGVVAGSSTTKTYTIVPPAVDSETIALVAGKKSFTLSWEKPHEDITGYQIQYSTNSNMSKAKSVSVKGADTLTKTIGSSTASTLKSNTTYYIKVRALTSRTVGKTTKTYYSDWSSSVSVRTK